MINPSAIFALLAQLGQQVPGGAPPPPVGPVGGLGPNPSQMAGPQPPQPPQPPMPVGGMGMGGGAPVQPPPPAPVPMIPKPTYQQPKVPEIETPQVTYHPTKKGARMQERINLVSGIMKGLQGMSARQQQLHAQRGEMVANSINSAAANGDTQTIQQILSDPDNVKALEVYTGSVLPRVPGGPDAKKVGIAQKALSIVQSLAGGRPSPAGPSVTGAAGQPGGVDIRQLPQAPAGGQLAAQAAAEQSRTEIVKQRAMRAAIEGMGAPSEATPPTYPSRAQKDSANMRNKMLGLAPAFPSAEEERQASNKIYDSLLTEWRSGRLTSEEFFKYARDRVGQMGLGEYLDDRALQGIIAIPQTDAVKVQTDGQGRPIMAVVRGKEFPIGDKDMPTEGRKITGAYEETYQRRLQDQMDREDRAEQRKVADEARRFAYTMAAVNARLDAQEKMRAKKDIGQAFTAYQQVDRLVNMAKNAVRKSDATGVWGPTDMLLTSYHMGMTVGETRNIRTGTQIIEKHMAARSWPEAVMRAGNAVIHGDQLSPQQRQMFLGLLEDKVQAVKNAYEDKRQFYGIPDEPGARSLGTGGPKQFRFDANGNLIPQ